MKLFPWMISRSPPETTKNSISMFLNFFTLARRSARRSGRPGYRGRVVAPGDQRPCVLLPEFAGVDAVPLQEGGRGVWGEGVVEVKDERQRRGKAVQCQPQETASTQGSRASAPGEARQALH